MRAFREMAICVAWTSVVAAGACGGTDQNSSDNQVSLGANGSPITTGGAAGGTGGMSGAAGSAVSGSQPGAPNQQPTFAPSFPGAGTSGDDAPLMNGQLCDYVPLKGDFPTADQATTCYFDKNGDPVPAATMEQVLECVDGQDVVHLRLTFNPDFVDNTYGTGSIGWPVKRGHTFKDLTGSDHAELLIQDGNGDVVLQFKMDYLTADSSAPSGFACLGVSGGDGKIVTGDASWVLDATSSLDRNLNDRGYGAYTVDSPTTDVDYTANSATPEWDYRVVYEAWIDVAALGGNGFGGAFIEYVHASPSKSSDDTIEVEPGDCPPTFCADPNGCYSTPPEDCSENPEGCDSTPPDACVENPDDPMCADQVPPMPPMNPCPPDDPMCAGTGTPTPPTPEYCAQYPDDPNCNLI